MAIKNRTLLRNLKKLIYVIIICLTAIATIYFTGIHSPTVLADRTNTNNLAIENPPSLTLQEFPLGWIDRVERPQTPAKVAQEGINFLIPYTQSYDRPTIETYLNNARQNGIKVFLEPYREPVRNEDAAAVAEFVRTYKNHPAVAGWYLYDEPAANKVSPQTLEISYQAIKAEDPNHPIAIVFASSQTAKVPQYLNAMDIYMIDRYPLFYGKPEFDNLHNFGQWMQQAASYAGDKPFWPVLQGYGEGEDGKPQYNRRLPTAAEERYMFYTAVLAGADGLLFYGHHLTQQSWIDSVLNPLIAEFRGFLPIVNANLVAKPLVNRADIQAVLYQVPSSERYLLIAVHHGKGQVNVTFNLESTNLTNLSNIKVVGQNKQVELQKNSLIDSFDSYNVRIYELS